MSPDEIFAAQFWPWPDPAVKRDATGRILFVNAAFLKLYGGQPQDWHGNAVGGWSVPQAAGQSHRFETRIPGQSGGMDEQVYDWIEMTFADGSAFALARNVTIFQPSPAPVVPEETFTPPPVQQATVNDYVPSAPEHEALPVPAMQDPSVPQHNTDVALDDATTQVEQSAPVVPAAADNQPIDAPQVEVDSPAEGLESPDVSDAAPEPERAYERRALPIESDSAVLGNNWRDAVIAKAVGAEVAEVKGDTETDPVPAEANAAASGHDDEQAGTASKILLAEDNAINALLTRTLLEAEGHIVDTVEDGQLAVEAMKTSTYDLIFMDMRMPNMDGLEATRKIRALPNVSRELPIVALTANAFDDDRNACFDSGMNDFMTKPVSAEELSDMVKNWTQGAKQKLAS